MPESTLTEPIKSDIEVSKAALAHPRKGRPKHSIHSRSHGPVRQSSRILGP